MMTPALLQAMRFPVRGPDKGLHFTPIFRVSFPHLDVPWGNQENPNAPPSYQCNGLFDDTADLTQMRALLDNALVQKFGPMAPQLVSAGVYRYALRPKAAKMNFQGYEGNGWFCALRARQETPPACVDISTGRPLLLQIGAIERVIYAGCFAYAAYNVYAFDKGGGKGVSMGLRTLVKVAEGEHFAGLPPVTRDEAAAAIANVNIPGVVAMPQLVQFAGGQQTTSPLPQQPAPATVQMPVGGREQDLLDAMQ